MTDIKLFKKITAVLFTIVMIAAMFAACDETDDTQTMTTTTAATTSDDENLPTYEPDGTARLSTDLPDYDWGGYNFKVLTHDFGGAPDLGIWSVRDIAAEEETGDPINDAVYKRNRTLEKKYNFAVKQLFSDSVLRALRSSISAGDNYFDAASMSFKWSGLAAAAQEGLLVDLFDVQYLDFEKPWWDKDAVKNFSIGNRLFFASGDFRLVNRDSISMILFNKGLLADLELENPYELVRGSRWTLSELYEMAGAAATDLDGNGGRLDLKTDRFGFVVGAVEFGLERGMGMRVADKDADDLPFLVFENERNFNVMYAVRELTRADFTWSVGGGGGVVHTGGDSMLSPSEIAFTEGRVLFMESTIRTIESLREFAVNFGILPMPWFDENQGRWFHSAGGIVGAGGIAVPAFQDYDAINRTGFMLEAISAESRHTVIPAHYDVQLTGKFIRDDESSEMLDVIFNSVVWDLGLIYNWIGYDVWGAAGSGRLASVWESNRNKIEYAVQETIEALAALD